MRPPQAAAARRRCGGRLGDAAAACPTLVRRPALVPSLPTTVSVSLSCSPVVGGSLSREKKNAIASLTHRSCAPCDILLRDFVSGNRTGIVYVARPLVVR
eukprot:scaffold44528_cov21-Phaeocystis_antarctica.AAC.1